MSYADIAIIVIMGLSIILGFIKGFWRTFSKAITLVGALALGFVFASTLAPLIFKDNVLTVFNDLLGQIYVKGATPIVEVANLELVSANGAWGVIKDGQFVALVDALKLLFVPAFLHGPIVQSVGSIAGTGTITLGNLVTSAASHFLSLILSGTIIFLGSLIVLRIIAKLIYNAFHYKTFHRAFDRICGGIFRIVTGGLFVIIVLYIISMLSGFEFMEPVINQITSGKISGPLYEADLLNKLFYGEGMNKIADLFKTIILPSVTESPAALLIG